MNILVRHFICLSLLCVGCNFFTAGVRAETAPPIEKAPEQKAEQKTAFDYDYYEELMQPVPTKEHERLCGLDKVCIELWRKQKMEVWKEGRLFTGDFNGDGVTDEAVILEGEDPDDEAEKVFYVYISSKDKATGQRKVEFHELLAGAKNVVDVFWDKNKNALVIDTGGRVVRTESATTSVGAAGTGFSYATGKVLKVVLVVSWDAKANKYELIYPNFETPKRKHLPK